jgi:hypothetical protein
VLSQTLKLISAIDHLRTSGCASCMQDGEVESFELLPIGEVARIIAGSRDFKPNCCLVIIDFMIRHGVLTPDQAQYADLVKALHV